MKLLDWMNGRNATKQTLKRGQSFRAMESAGLEAMTQHFDDGIVGCKQGGEWEKTFNEMADGLTPRFRDPSGDRPVSISPREANALNRFHKTYEREVEDRYPGSARTRADAAAIRVAPDRDGMPDKGRAWKPRPDDAGKTVRLAMPSRERQRWNS